MVWVYLSWPVSWYRNLSCHWCMTHHGNNFFANLCCAGLKVLHSGLGISRAGFMTWCVGSVVLKLDCLCPKLISLRHPVWALTLANISSWSRVVESLPCVKLSILSVKRLVFGSCCGCVRFSFKFLFAFVGLCLFGWTPTAGSVGTNR